MGGGSAGASISACYSRRWGDGDATRESERRRNRREQGSKEGQEGSGWRKAEREQAEVGWALASPH